MAEHLAAAPNLVPDSEREERVRRASGIANLDTYRKAHNELNRARYELDGTATEPNGKLTADELESKITDIVWLPLSPAACRAAFTIYNKRDQFQSAMNEAEQPQFGGVGLLLDKLRTRYPSHVMHEYETGGLGAFRAFLLGAGNDQKTSLAATPKILREYYSYIGSRLEAEANFLSPFHNHQPYLSSTIAATAERCTPEERLAMYEGAFFVSQLMKFGIYQARCAPGQNQTLPPNRVITS